MAYNGMTIRVVRKLDEETVKKIKFCLQCYEQEVEIPEKIKSYLINIGFKEAKFKYFADELKGYDLENYELIGEYLETIKVNNPDNDVIKIYINDIPKDAIALEISYLF